MSIRMLQNAELVGLLVGNRMIVSVCEEFGLDVPMQTTNAIAEAEAELRLRAESQKLAKINKLQARLQGLKTRTEMRTEIENELKALLAK